MLGIHTVYSEHIFQLVLIVAVEWKLVDSYKDQPGNSFWTEVWLWQVKFPLLWEFSCFCAEVTNTGDTMSYVLYGADSLRIRAPNSSSPVALLESIVERYLWAKVVCTGGIL